MKEGEKEEQTTDIQISKEVKEQAIVKLDNITDSGQLYSLAKVLCESKLLPVTYNTPEKALLCIAQGRELGLGAVTSLYNMYFIQGKPVLSIHAINALITSKGIAFKTISDYEKVENAATGASTRVTEIMFYRKHKELNMIIEERIKYTWQEAEIAGLASKDNWQKYPKVMLWNRCFTFGARRIASDYLLGVMEISEAGDTFNKTYKLDNEGNAEFEEIK